MAAPKQIQDAAAAADALHKEFYGSAPAPDTPEPTTDVAPEPVPDTPEPTTDVAPEPASEPVPEVVEPTPDVAPEPASEPAPEATPNWQARYDTLQGKYNSEISQLRSLLNEQSARADSLTQVLAATTSTKEGDTSVAEASSDGLGVFQASPEDTQEWGGDFFAMTDRQVRAVVGPLVTQVNALQSQVANLAAQLSQTSSVVHTAQTDSMFSRLDQSAANWRQLNEDEGFLAWLDQQDPFSGQPRRVLFNTALQTKDVVRLATFFNAYNGEQQVVSPQAGASATRIPPANGAARVASRSLDTMAAPGRGKQTNTGTSTNQGNEHNWTNTDISEFYDDVRRGTFDSRPADKAAIEADIFRAAAQGRVG